MSNYLIRSKQAISDYVLINYSEKLK